MGECTKTSWTCTSVVFYAITIFICTICSSFITAFVYRLGNCADDHWGEACRQGPCQNGGTCSITGKSYACTCTDKFIGWHCETENPCFGRVCLNGGNCTISGDKYVCSCPKEYSGVNCEIASNPCDSSPCGNGGVCSQVGMMYHCQCDRGNIGQNCLTGDPCSLNPCKNGGSCSMSGGDFHCSCPPTHYGQICEYELIGETDCQKAITKQDYQQTISFIMLGFVCLAIVLLIGLITTLLVFRFRKPKGSAPI